MYTHLSYTLVCDKKNVCEYILINNFHFILLTTDKLGITNNQLVYIYITEFKMLLIYVFIYLLIIIYLCDLYIILDTFKIKKKKNTICCLHSFNKVYRAK